MTVSQIYWMFYAFFMVVRIPANAKRWRMPMMRGEGYFFNTRVAPDFFLGPGRDLLRRYRLALFPPFLLDAAGLPFIVWLGKPEYLIFLILLDTAVGLVYYIALLKRAVQWAKPFEVEAPPAATAVVFPLETRRVSDYTNPSVDWAVALINLSCLAAIGR